MAHALVLIVSDDTGYGDLGPYGGGEGRGMPTPSLDRIAADGMTFPSFYAQPSCTAGRAAMQTGRLPNRSGMTVVAFQELQDLFDKEATKNQVYPLINWSDLLPRFIEFQRKMGLSPGGGAPKK